jgi:uncharacterized membrane protein
VDWISSLDVGAVWRAASAAMCGWLALFFGRTLLPGREALIERIARVSDPDLKPPLVRYTRWLTALWCAYFVMAAVLLLYAGASSFPAGIAVSMGSVVLFVGEHRLRHLIFRGESFPGLVQQVRDTWSVWHPGKRIAD